MRMTGEEFERETRYQTSTLYMKKLVSDGLITKEEYCRIELQLQEKYHPVTGTLLSRNSLLSGGSRANMPAGKEAEKRAESNQT